MAKNSEKGILKLEPRPRMTVDTSSPRVLTPQGSYDLAPPSPQPSVDRLSVTFADPEPSSMASGINLFHLPSDAPINNEVKFSPSAGDGSDDEDYSASLSAVLRQRRASVRRSRKGRGRRPSSPFLPDEVRPRRRSSAFTTSSGETAISMEEGQTGVSTVGLQEQIFENIQLHKEVLGSVKQQLFEMRRKLKIVQQAKAYIKRHEGQLQERLAQSKSTRDIYARFNILLNSRWQQLKREAANTSILLIPWELRIKEIESHFGSVVASYFTFLRWLFWVNLVIGLTLVFFVIVPECLTANPEQDGDRKIIMEDEMRNATNLLTFWEFGGVLKSSPIFYGYYTNVERPEYRMPLAYFLTGIVVYVYSFVAILRKMAENSRMSKLSEKEDECTFSWKLFTGWDFMIGNTETAQNRIASINLGFKEALLEEAERKKDIRNWRILCLRAIVNISVFTLLGMSAYAVVTVVSYSDDKQKNRDWLRENMTTIVITAISILFPYLFEILGYLEHYHPRKQLRWQLARIMLLNLLNLYSLIIALFSKIEGMSAELDSLKPTLNLNVTVPPSGFNINESLNMNIAKICTQEKIVCPPCNFLITISKQSKERGSIVTTTQLPNHPFVQNPTKTTRTSTKRVSEITTTPKMPNLMAENLEDDKHGTTDLSILQTTTENILLREFNKIRKLGESTVSEFDSDYETDANNNSYYEYGVIDSSENYEASSSEDSVTTHSTSSDNGIDYTFLISSNTHSETTDSNLPSSVPNTDETTETGRETLSTSSIQNEIISGVSLELDQSTTDFTTLSNDKTEIVSGTITRLLLGSDETTVDISTELVTDRSYTEDTIFTTNEISTVCPNITFNCSVVCAGVNITQSYFMTNCSYVEVTCYITNCTYIENQMDNLRMNQTNQTAIDVMYFDQHNRSMYSLTAATKKKLLKLCWETMFGQELVKLTMMDLVFVLLGTLFMDFYRALLVRYLNRCWCWNLEKRWPEYGDFKIAENILHLINNQGMVWMGMFFSPGLVVLNVFKLMIIMYLRSWAVMACNVPHEVVFRVSKSNNFYLALLLTMLFLCVLPVGYSIVYLKPSWHCGPFSEYNKIYLILTNNIYKLLPKQLHFALIEYMTSPAIVIPLLVLLILVISYLVSLTNSLREANNDLKIQLRRERTEERRKVIKLVSTKRRPGSALENTPFDRWKKALPSLPFSKSIDSDERKASTDKENKELPKNIKNKGGIFAKIVNMALDRKSDVEAVSELSPSPNADDETDTDFHETLPRELLKDITIEGKTEKRSIDVDSKIDNTDSIDYDNLRVDNVDNRSEKNAILEKQNEEERDNAEVKAICDIITERPAGKTKKLSRKHTSESSTQSKQSDSIGSVVVPVITISATESDDEILQTKGNKANKPKEKRLEEKEIKASKSSTKSSPETKYLRRQSSVDSVKDRKPKSRREKPAEEGHKFQYSL